MILILFSWIYIFFTSVVIGFAFNKLGLLKNKNCFTISILGFFSTTVIARVWAIFGRINIEFHVFLLLTNFSISLLYKSELSHLFRSFYNQVNSFSKSQKIFILFISLLVTLKCTFSSNFIDNETYYIRLCLFVMLS